MRVTTDMLSSVQLSMWADMEHAELELKGANFIGPIKPNVSDSAEKLIPNLRNKDRYIVHYRNLKLYIELGELLHTLQLLW